MNPLFYLGCQGWAHPPWVGNFFTHGARRAEFLPQYASVFNAAEGNATFYGLPPAGTMAKWCAEAPEHFRFCFKFPQAISHERRLRGAGAETTEFLTRVSPLGGRLGPFFLQLHASFGPAEMPELEACLRTLPREFCYAVEVRHADFFDGASRERALDQLLGELGMERVNFDTRGLFAARADDDAVRAAQCKKPRVPVRFTAIGRSPFVRFVGDPVVEKNTALLAEWAEQVARWIEEGRTPWFFAHHPDDLHAPRIARLFQQRLQARATRVPAPAVWPVERESAARGTQLGLF